VGGGVLALLAALVLPGMLQAQGWGDVKGQVVWGGDKLPTPVVANVDKDKPHCLGKGPIYTNEYVVNPKNKGVRYTLVWLVDATDPAKPLPINPDLPKPTKPVEIDQPCCEFLPRVVALQASQELKIKNPAPVSHNFFLNGGSVTADVNRLMPPNTDFIHKGFKASWIPRPPMPYSCSIHAWMKGYIGVFNHPYFAVTDEDGKFSIPKAPAGTYRLVAWQEGKGWLEIDPANAKLKGRVINIKANGTTEVELKLQPESK
jgi:hypothetical protein